MLPTSTTGAAMRDPSPAAVQTIIPSRMSATRTSPLGVGAGLLASRASYGIEIRVAEDGRADSVDHLEFELVDGQRAADSAACAARRTAGDRHEHQANRKLQLHPLNPRHVWMGLKVTERGTKPTRHAYSR